MTLIFYRVLNTYTSTATVVCTCIGFRLLGCRGGALGALAVGLWLLGPCPGPRPVGGCGWQGARIPPHQPLTPLPPAGGNGAASASGSIVGFSHFNHVAPSGGMVRVGEQRSRSGGTNENGGTNGGTKRAFLRCSIGELESLPINRFEGWKRNNVRASA